MVIHKSVGPHLNIIPNNLFVDTNKNVAIFGGLCTEANLQRKSGPFPDQIASEASDVFSLGLCFLYFLQQVVNANFGFGTTTTTTEALFQRQLEYSRVVVKGKSLLEFLTTTLSQMVAFQPERRPTLAKLIQQLQNCPSKMPQKLAQIEVGKKVE